MINSINRLLNHDKSKNKNNNNNKKGLKKTNSSQKLETNVSIYEKRIIRKKNPNNNLRLNYAFFVVVVSLFFFIDSFKY